jgi:hypothetical protein
MNTLISYNVMGIHKKSLTDQLAQMKVCICRYYSPNISSDMLLYISFIEYSSVKLNTMNTYSTMQLRIKHFIDNDKVRK